MDLRGWLPIYTYWSGDRFLVDWCYTGGQRFTDPFFGDTVDRLCGDLAVRLFRHQTGMEAAQEWNECSPGLAPSGFLFHMSRCGSTLVSQMLAAAPRNRVLSEPTALNGLFRAALLRPGIPRATLVDWLRTVVGAMGRPLEGESRYFLKLDCWHVLALPLIVEAFPETPWIFLHRDPAEVLVSQMKLPGAWTVPSVLEPEVFGMKPEETRGMPMLEYRARLLAAIGTAALRHRKCGRGRLVNYQELPGWVSASLPGHFHLAFDQAELERMGQAARWDAKTPQMEFSSDRREKLMSVTPEIQSAVDRWLAPVFGQLAP